MILASWYRAHRESMPTASVPQTTTASDLTAMDDPAAQQTDTPAAGSTSPEALSDEQREKAMRQEQLDEVVRLERAYPNDHNAAYLMGLVHLEQGSYDKALDQWHQCQQLNPNRADLYNSMAQTYVLKGQLDEADVAFRQALALQPDLLDARVRLAENLLRQGKLEDVVRTLDAALPTVPTPAPDGATPREPDKGTTVDEATAKLEQGYLLLGQALQQLDQQEQAKRSFLNALAILPTSAEAHYGLARVCLALKQPDEARVHQEQFRQLARAQQDKGRVDHSAYDPLQVVRASLAHSHTDIGRVYVHHGESAQAERLWRRAAEVAPDDTPSRLHLAEYYRSQGRILEALAVYTQLAELDPMQGRYLFDIGNVNLLLKRLDAAEAAYRKAIELEPNRADAYRALAQFYLVSRRNLPEAIPLARRALALSPSAPVYVLLGDLYAETGDLDGAITAMEQATRLEPGNVPWQQRLEKLRRRKGTR